MRFIRIFIAAVTLVVSGCTIIEVKNDKASLKRISVFQKASADEFTLTNDSVQLKVIKVDPDESIVK